MCSVKFFAAAIAISLTSTVIAQSSPPLQVMVDPRVELFSIIFRLAGNPEYNKSRVDAYTKEVELQFRPFENHEVVKLARQLRNRNGVSYDACMSMAVSVGDAYELRPIVPLQSGNEGFDNRWTPESAGKFLELARQFVKESGFRDFISGHQTLYHTTADRMKSLMEKEEHLDWFNSYFGEHSEAQFTLVLALLNGGNCYGPHCRDAAGKEQFFSVLGVWKTDSEGLPEFDSGMAGTVVHEFNHSYANPIINRHEKEFDPAGEKLFAHVADKMRAQAYGAGHTVLCESLVRACQVRYELQYHGKATADRQIDYENKRGFLWTKELSDVLADYEQHRDSYPTLESFSPRLIKFFADYAEEFDKKQAKLEAKRPKVVSIKPVNGAKNVDPGLKQIQVVFDRPMHRSWAFVGGGPHCPKTAGACHYDAACKTWTVPVTLKPNWDYEFWLNSETYDGFQSADGVSLEPVHVRFTTGASAEPVSKSE